MKQEKLFEYFLVVLAALALIELVLRNVFSLAFIPLTLGPAALTFKTRLIMLSVFGLTAGFGAIMSIAALEKKDYNMLHEYSLITFIGLGMYSVHQVMTLVLFPESPEKTVALIGAASYFFLGGFAFHFARRMKRESESLHQATSPAKHKKKSKKKRN